ncbi:Histone deacetylase complex subunit SAP18 [Escovopsis weberi]|uniref:Histone deacetylase complex subunit SAP18 n=1 Tax=Escovopsis weberi TaxID=150374 RepID=A0A0M9VRR9_ESCWE|nr:Histone deacetylase complex subunit SAP18 [Escovopsis weberi]
MSIVSDKNYREVTVPFLVKLFHRNGAFHRPEEFAAPSLPASHVSVYTWSNCTLNELALELAASEPSALPNPAIGTRLAFQLVCPDLRGTSAANTAHPRYMVKDLGSIVIGGGGPGIDDLDDGGLDGTLRDEDAGQKTLADARFVVGDYLSCAVLPPLADSSVAPASTAKRNSVAGRGARGGARVGMGARDADFGRSNGRSARDGRRDSGGGFPMGEWRRGEKLPEGPPGRPRGRGRW